jgi:alpha,alpha-trehalase
MNPWVLRYDGYDPDEEGLREALCTLGNGYIATRGAVAGSCADGVHYPGTYAAGVYNRLQTTIAGRTIENESLVNLPDWLVLRFAVDDGPWLAVDDVDVLDHNLELDMRQGVLTRRWRIRDDRGRTTRLVERRLVHMAHEHLAALETTLVAEDWSGRLRVRSGLDGDVANRGVERYADLASEHLDVAGADAVDERTLLLTAVTRTSRIRIAEAARTTVRREGEATAPAREVHRDGGRIAHDLALDVDAGEELIVEKVAAVYTSRDSAIFEPGFDAVHALCAAGTFDQLLAGHTMAWGHLWDRCRFEVHVDDEVVQIVRLHLFHLLQTVSPNTIDLDAGVPPRGLHGEAYRGLVMWDELFTFPVLDLRLPALTRSLLGYRYRRLPAARSAALQAGHEGAMYPWQSGSNGEEMAQEVHLNPQSGRWVPDDTHLQRHIGLAVAYNVWRYYQATGDVAFLADQGAEMMLEIARFFASITSYDHGRDRYEIRGVVGPDEFHTAYPGADEPGLRNNAYTNVMAAWLLRRACVLPGILSPDRWSELSDSLAIGRDERERWDEISRKLVVPFHDDGVISQFEGYEDLEELPWEELRERHGRIHRLDRILEAEGDSPNRYKATKQADTLMLFYLFSADELRDLLDHLGYGLEPEQIPATIEYYLPRTTHGSTLSTCVYAWVLARAHREEAYDFFARALRSDIADIQGGTTPEGIHLGAMAGSVDLLQRCFTGLEMRGDELMLNPFWPPELGPLEIDIVYRGHPLTLRVTGEVVRVASQPGDRAPIHVSCRGETAELRPGETVELSH